MDKRVVVCGAGVGGLAAAIELASCGHVVKLYERASRAGGKARLAEVGTGVVDAGPTVLTMPWVFDELFDAGGADFRSSVALERLEVLARHTWLDGKTLDLFADPDASADAIGAAFGASEARGYRAFSAAGKRLYSIAEEPFLKSPRMTMAGIMKRFGVRGVATLGQLDSHRSMWRSLEEYFTSPELRQLFGRYATYVGSSPWEAPATLNLVAHVEAQGVYRAAGGMYGLVRALEDLARRLGVELHYSAPVERFVVRGGRVRAAIVQGAEQAADAFVFNGDASALGAGLLGPDVARATKPTPLDERSLSAVTWTLPRSEHPSLTTHNVFFSSDYRAEFVDLLERRRVPAEPTIYVCAQEHGLLVLANAPANGDREPWDAVERQRCTSTIFGLLRRFGWNLDPGSTEPTTPRDFERAFPSTGGALYGPRSTGPFSALTRLGSESKVPGLYLAGGSVHPGPGVPMAALSGRLVASRIREDLASTGR